MIAYKVVSEGYNGPPMGKQRPRVCKGHAFTPAKTVAYEKLVKSVYHLKGLPALTGALEVNITAYFPIPKSTPKKYLQGMKEGTTYHIKKGDADNVAKIILDGLNGIAYEDDGQVSILHIVKRYGEEPRVEVKLKEI